MSWIKLDDGIAEHPKILRAGPAAAWLYVCGLTYASRQLTDGFIPTDALLRISGDARLSRLHASYLVREQLWEQVDGGWQVHDYLEYQTSAESVRKKLDQDRYRKRTTPDGIRAESARIPSGVVPTKSPTPAQSSGRIPSTRSHTDPIQIPSDPVPEIDTKKRNSPLPSGAPRAAARAPVGPGDELPASGSVPSTTSEAPPPVRAAKLGLAPLADAFAARGLSWPRVSGAEAKAASELLRQLGADVVADCWQDLSDPDSPYGWDAVDVRNRSFAWLLSHNRAGNWRDERERQDRLRPAIPDAETSPDMPYVLGRRLPQQPERPPRDPTRELWDKALDELRGQMQPSDFRSWFEGTELESNAGGFATVSVANEHMVSWLEVKCRGLVERVLRALVGEPVEVAFVAREGVAT